MFRALLVALLIGCGGTDSTEYRIYLDEPYAGDDPTVIGCLDGRIYIDAAYCDCLCRARGYVWGTICEGDAIPCACSITEGGEEIICIPPPIPL